MAKITTLLFDCDNTLVLSEELAFEACAELANQILERHDVPDRYTGPQLLSDFVGQNFRGMMMSLQKKYNFNLSDEEFDKYVTKEEDQVIATLEKKARPCVGVNEELDKIYAAKKYELAVVSSSAYRRVKASIEKVGQTKYFSLDKVFSAATSLEKPTSKPDPAIYLHSLKVLEKKGDECVAIEDSRSGALSAVRAGIHLIGYVGSYGTEEKKEEMREVLEDIGAKFVMKEWTEFDTALAKITGGESS